MKNLFKNLNLKVVEWFKVFAPIALAVILAGLIVILAGGLNIGLDFAGGGKLSVRLGEYPTLNPDSKTQLEEVITNVIEDNKYDVSSLRWSENDTDGAVLEVGISYEYDGKKIDASDVDAQKTFTNNITGVEGEYENSLISKIEAEVNKYSAENFKGFIDLNESIGFNIVNGSTAQKTLTNAIWATLAAVAVILVYIIIRFTLSSGLSAIIALVHDVLVMLSLTAIFGVQINVTFIAAIITIVGYSINETIVIFDRIRELKTLDSLKDYTDTEIANRAVKDTLSRSILTTITTMATIVVLAIVCEIIGVTTMAEFALPIIFGLVGGFYSSVFLSSSIWVYLRRLGKKITALTKKDK